ncbi:patatin-like phospholipase family protein [Hydrogenophaga crocea]|uniref:BamA/TamA family outer membrane protein n=1 Tax=Hydrogenophaga crocea TaxID=2716225 RepID=A0A6G8IIH3_9BURK|nr:patatin-like phospholipase family protein [Hydrogenophaga crocea]QIM53007.1 BamA/TamA family outer membrane protein [Hydrogenophaga crocea]
MAFRPTLLLLCLALLAAPLRAQDKPDTSPGATQAASTPQPELPRPRIALVLSGGGARGFAHVGVLKALEAARVPVDLIVGTSMGAIVGGLYAAGMNADELEREILGVDWNGLFSTRQPRQVLSQRRKEEDFELSPVLLLGFRDGEFRLPTGAVSSRSLEILLRRYTLPTRHLASFDALPTRFRAVATDMETGKPVVMDRGDLAAALRASMSVPGVFSPLEIEGRILGDGGLVNNLPVSVARDLGAEMVIAVNIGTPLAPRDTLGSLLGISTQMINILTEQNVQASIALLTPRDLLLTPPLGTLTSGDFNRSRELVKLGHDYAQTVAASLARYTEDSARYAAWTEARRTQAELNATRVGRIANIRFEGVNEQRAERLGQGLAPLKGQRADVDRIEDDMEKIAATGDYERIDYRLVRNPDTGGEDLVIGLRENNWGPNYLRVGLDLRTDFRGDGSFNLRLSHNRHWLTDSGTEWRNRVQLGETMGLYSEIFQPLGLRGSSFLSAYGDLSIRKVELYGNDDSPEARIRRESVRIGLDLGWPFGPQGSVGEFRLGALASERRSTLELVSPDATSLPAGVRAVQWRETGLRAAVLADQLDFANFPSRGWRALGEVVVGQRTTTGVPGSSNFTRVEASYTGVRSWGPHTFNMGLRVAHANRIPLGAIDEYSLGGFQNLSGFRPGQVAGNYLAFGRLSYYRRLPWDVGIARALFAGGSLEAGNAWINRSEVSLKNLYAGNSLFLGADTGIGPLYLALVSAPKGFTGLYLFLGRP